MPSPQRRFRLVELLPGNRRQTIDSGLLLETAKSCIDICEHLDPSRPVIIEAVDSLEWDGKRSPDELLAIGGPS